MGPKLRSGGHGEGGKIRMRCAAQVLCAQAREFLAATTGSPPDEERDTGTLLEGRLFHLQRLLALRASPHCPRSSASGGGSCGPRPACWHVRDRPRASPDRCGSRSRSRRGAKLEGHDP